MKTNYTYEEKRIFKINKFKQRDLFLMENAIIDKARILKELERFKNTFKNEEVALSVLKQFVYSCVLSRNSLLSKGDILKEIKESSGVEEWKMKMVIIT